MCFLELRNVEAAIQSQTIFLKHIYYRLSPGGYGGGYSPLLNRALITRVTFEMMKNSNYALLSIFSPPFDCTQGELLYYTTRMLEDHIDLEQCKEMLKEYFRVTDARGFSDDIITLCADNNRPELWRAMCKIIEKLREDENKEETSTLSP